MISKVLKFIIFLLIFVIQISFFSASSFLRENLNLVLIVLIYYLYISTIRDGLAYGLAFGILLEFFSAYPFGVILLSLLTALLVASLLIKNVFTNRSFLSFMTVILISTVVYYLALLLFSYLASFVSQFAFRTEFIQTISQLFTQVVTNILIGIIVYYFATMLVNIIGKRFLISKTSQ